ncbi:tat (twin-arginine translocation) pathway signal sequence domain protein [Mycobacteroides abscessus MAB_082312_2258]|nr:tat (twin-arginine translocation) pathway signal sequence domain protein [Mycobacteroides abscessus MAB_082312_2258]
MKSINRRTVLGGVGVAGVAAAAGAGTDWAFSPLAPMTIRRT